MSLITPAQMREALRDWLGNRVKIHPDWPHATTNGGFDAHGICHHWTAMSKRVSEERQVEVLRNGYSRLPGPLCHLSPTRAGDVWLIGWDNTNHAGLGDADVYRRVLAGEFDGTPGANDESIDGNAVLYGLEYQYHPDDGPMPDEQIEAGILAAAALSEAHGWSPEAAAGSNLDHFEWTGRKWDRRLDGLAHTTRRGVERALRSGPGTTFSEDEMSFREVWHGGVLDDPTTRPSTDDPKSDDITPAKMLRAIYEQTVEHSSEASRLLAALADETKSINVELAAVAERLNTAELSDAEVQTLANEVASKVDRLRVILDRTEA